LLARAAGADAQERLRALQNICRHRSHFTSEQLSQVVRDNAGSTDRFLRQASSDLFSTLQPSQQEALLKTLCGPREVITLSLDRPDARLARFVTDPVLAPEVRLDVVRALQLALGELTAAGARGTVWEGYTRRQESASLPQEGRSALRAAFPSGHATLDRELARALAMMEDDDPGVLLHTLDQLTADSHPVEDIHYLVVLACLRAPRTAEHTRRTADALIALDDKIVRRRLNRDRNWPLRIAETHVELAHKDSGLNAALLTHPQFGRADHVLFTRCPGFDRHRAAEIFLQRSKTTPEFAWNAEAVGLLVTLPDEQLRPLLRRLWGEYGLDDALLPLLARSPQAEDRPRLRSALTWPQTQSVLVALDALERLPPQSGDEEEAFALLLALHRLGEAKEVEPIRRRLNAALQKTTGQKLSGMKAWIAWARLHYSQRAARLEDADGVEVGAWERRLGRVNFPQGDAQRGQRVFTKASCAACHSGAQALGPDLRGVTSRFSRADLFTAIVRPSKDVSPRYRTTQIITEDEKVYQGLIIYEAVDSLLLQTGPTTTIRLTNPQIRQRRPATVSLMPAGLLDSLSDSDVADLYAYLQGLGRTQEAGR
jgi:putative heme-binding domain-containing protein